MTLLSSVDPVEEGPLERYLLEQADLTAVERFAQRHEADLLPHQARYYRDLIPAAAPRPGQQYAFDVDLDACTGCKACVTGCHSLNGLDDSESWRSVTLLRSAPTAKPAQRTVTAACHHCLDPACLKGCPVDAYEKDPVTGIVEHLDDQCIGCSYCTLTCPYEVPSYSASRGIVRKCDMCTDRLSVGEAPACVQACPNGAISITVVDVAEVRARTSAGPLVPGAPPSTITAPTTVYRSSDPEALNAAVAPAAAALVEPAHGHPPLAVMLVLTQLAVGAFVADLFVRAGAVGRSTGPLDALVAAAAAVLALGASVFHLGRPRYCYRAVIGIRHSWLSREVAAFGAFTGLAAVYALLLVLGSPAGRALTSAVAGAGAIAGATGVACSVVLYTVTRRASWRPVTVTVTFGLTAAAGGPITMVWTSLLSARAGWLASPVAPAVPLAALVLAALKLTGEAVALCRRSGDAARRARLLAGPLAPTARLRFVAGIGGGVVCPLLLVAMHASGRPSWPAVLVATIGVGAFVVGEIAERSLFFTTASPPR